MPPEITDMRKGFGVQAPDFDYRINRDFDKHKDELYRCLDEPLIRKYLDADKINTLVKEIKTAAETHSLDEIQCIQLAMLSSLGSFLKHHTK